MLLDNCEQITESCSWFLNDAFAAAPHLHVIATSREAFGLGGEHAYRLQPLGAPDAARLLVDRARSSAWESDGVAKAAERIAAICKRLDGLPLALELAASMLGTLALSDLERQLDENLVQLRSRDVTAPARHRSLADVIAWSMSLLTESEREAFARLSVFAGSLRGEYRRAHAHYAEALALCEQFSAELFFPYILSGIAALAIEGGRARDAARLLGAARRKDQGPKVSAQFHAYTLARSRTEAALGAELCTLEMRFGRDLTRTDAVKLANSVLAGTETT